MQPPSCDLDSYILLLSSVSMVIKSHGHQPFIHSNFKPTEGKREGQIIFFFGGEWMCEMWREDNSKPEERNAGPVQWECCTEFIFNSNLEEREYFNTVVTEDWMRPRVAGSWSQEDVGNCRWPGSAVSLVTMLKSCGFNSLPDLQLLKAQQPTFRPETSTFLSGQWPI